MSSPLAMHIFFQASYVTSMAAKDQTGHGGWADLPGDLVALVAAVLPLPSRAGLRAACSSWRAAVPAAPAASPWLVLFPDLSHGGPWPCVDALSLPERRFFHLYHRGHLPPLQRVSGKRCVGSGDGWLAFAGDDLDGNMLLNPLSGAAIPLPRICIHRFSLAACRRRRRPAEVSKIVFAPNPKPEDFFVLAIYRDAHVRMFSYVEAGRGEWRHVALELGRGDDYVMDAVYNGGEFYILARDGGVHVVEPTARESATVRAFSSSVDDIRRGRQRQAALFPADVAASLAFCGGELYQIDWISFGHVDQPRQTPYPGGLMVLRYVAEGRRAYWEKATHLGGYAVFLGKSNAVSVRAGGVAGLRPNCIYFCGGRRFSGCDGMVFDVETGLLEPFLPPCDQRSMWPAVTSWYFSPSAPRAALMAAAAWPSDGRFGSAFLEWVRKSLPGADLFCRQFTG